MAITYQIPTPRPLLIQPEYEEDETHARPFETGCLGWDIPGKEKEKCKG